MDYAKEEMSSLSIQEKKDGFDSEGFTDLLESFIKLGLESDPAKFRPNVIESEKKKVREEIFRFALCNKKVILLHGTNDFILEQKETVRERIMKAYDLLFEKYLEVYKKICKENTFHFLQEKAEMKKNIEDSQISSKLDAAYAVFSSCMRESKNFQYEEVYTTNDINKAQYYANSSGICGERSLAIAGMIYYIDAKRVPVSYTDEEKAALKLVTRLEKELSPNPVILVYEDVDLKNILSLEDGSELEEKNLFATQTSFRMSEEFDFQNCRKIPATEEGMQEIKDIIKENDMEYLDKIKECKQEVYDRIFPESQEPKPGERIRFNNIFSTMNWKRCLDPNTEFEI